jgi:dihydrolipoyl dehydrogenase
MAARPDGLIVSTDASTNKDRKQAPQTAVFGGVLVAVGRRPIGRIVGAHQAAVPGDERRFVPVDKAAAHQRRAHLCHR